MIVSKNYKLKQKLSQFCPLQEFHFLNKLLEINRLYIYSLLVLVLLAFKLFVVKHLIEDC
jgi:hypothetical protein